MNVSKYLPTTLIVCLVALAGCSDSPQSDFSGGAITPEELAKHYVLAVQSRDPASIKNLVHPKVFETLSPEDQKLLDRWIDRSIENAPKLVEPMWIRTRDISPEYLASLSEYWAWNVAPEVRIEMQPYKVIGEGEKEHTGFGTAQMAASSGGRLFFVFMFPKGKL